MNKFIAQIVIFVMVFLPTIASAQNINFAEIIEILIALDIIPASKADAARAVLDISIKANSHVKTTARLKVRVEPNGKVIDVQEAGAMGLTQVGPVKLAGYDWYEISYEKGMSGWSAGEYLRVVEKNVIEEVIGISESDNKSIPNVESNIAVESDAQLIGTSTSSVVSTSTGSITSTIVATSTKIATSTPKVYGENLLINGDFEDSKNYWIGWNNRIRIINEPYNGVEAVRLTASSGSSPSLVHSGIQINDDNKYRISGYVKTSVLYKSASLKVTWEDANEGSLRLDEIGSVTGSKEWTLLESVIVPPTKATNVQLQINVEAGSGAATFDKIMIQEELN